MRIRSVWLDGLSFLAALLMVGSAVCTAMECRAHDEGFVVTALAAGVFAILAIVFLWISFTVGGVRQRARDLRNKRQ
jgi:hypothetical protein